MTAGWVGVACSEPPMISLAIRPSRFSYDLIKASGEFVINIPTANILKEVDYCGTYSGRHVDKFQRAGLTPLLASRVRPPLIEECPVNLECIVRESLRLGTHELFIGEVLVVSADPAIIVDRGKQQNALGFGDINPIVVNFLEYWNLGKKLGDAFQEHREKVF